MADEETWDDSCARAMIGKTMAAPGRYTLRMTGEVVENPDFTATWEINPPKDPAP
jgi:hypothetical protein